MVWTRGISYMFSMIIWVRVVLRKTVIGDWHFDHQSGSHLQSQELTNSYWWWVFDKACQETRWQMLFPAKCVFLLWTIGPKGNIISELLFGSVSHICSQFAFHLQRNGKVILENVTEDGKELQGSLGRLMNPGHAIEAGWFLLQHATKRQDYDLARMAIDKFMLQPFQSGWDTKYGGIFYFLDANGLSPTQLEWNMKLWWPHTEALVAFLMAYKETKDKALLEMFDKVFQYTFSHVSAQLPLVHVGLGRIWI